MSDARILVIKLGALGDLVQAMGPAAAIRRHHADARIVLLTTAPFAALARRAPYFDEVWIDERPRVWDLAAMLRLRRRLRGGRFRRVYDLQTSDRSSFYLQLMRPGAPEWSGIALFCSHPHRNPERDRMHTLDRQAEQLAAAGIRDVPPPDVSWAAEDVRRFAVPAGAFLLVPGGSAHRPEKRWPADNYIALARRIAAAGGIAAVLGGAGERALGEAIAASVPGVRSLAGETTFGDIVGLARTARRVVGNDTGPVHLAVAAGAPATVLYSAASDPALTAPRGRDVVILRRDPLAALTVDAVAATLGIG